MKHTLPHLSLMLVPLAAALVATGAAHAAPAVGPGDMSFYDAPAPTARAGELLSYRPTTLNLGRNAPGHGAWNVKYQSTNSKGAPNIVTGTVIVPTAPWSGSGTRPVLSYAVGTHGLAQRCAPSLQLSKGTDYETANIVAALKAGYAVLVTDYYGYTNNATPTYLAGASQAHAVLDIIRAASQLPTAGIAANTKAVIWGFSQGGQSAAWAGQRKAAYAPEINLVGVAAGGVPADFSRTAAYLDGSFGSSFLLAGVVGLSEEYPEGIPINELANDLGKATIARGKDECVFEALFDLMNKRLSEFTVGNQTLQQLEQIPSVSATLKAQNLGADKIPVPLYQYHGKADEFIPIDQAVALKKKYCSKWANVTFDVYPSEHIATQFQAAPYALSWLTDRVAGKSTSGSCLTLAAEPKSTANPPGGNFVVSLDAWKLVATVGLKTLAQTVTLPEKSTFTADTDITAKTLKGNLSVPDFTAPIKIAGIGAGVGMRITPVGDTTGTAELDTAGTLKVRGMAKADITITSLAGIPIAPCKTVTPVEFPLNFEGPVSALGGGSLTFNGTTRFPQFKGCSVSAILSSLVSGDGQTFSFTVVPPAPTRY